MKIIVTFSGGKDSLAKDVVKYIKSKNATFDMFNEPTSCMSFYGICE